MCVRTQQPIADTLCNFAHAESLQHFGRTLELDGLTLLLDGQRRQEDWNNPVLTKRDPMIRVTRDLQNELAVPPFIEKLISRQTTEGQAT